MRSSTRVSERQVVHQSWCVEPLSQDNVLGQLVVLRAGMYNPSRQATKGNIMAREKGKRAIALLKLATIKSPKPKNDPTNDINKNYIPIHPYIELASNRNLIRLCTISVSKWNENPQTPRQNDVYSDEDIDACDCCIRKLVCRSSLQLPDRSGH